ncbi:MAG: glycosyl hydrolase [Steroidobacteraceae bacterium]
MSDELSRKERDRREFLRLAAGSIAIPLVGVGAAADAAPESRAAMMLAAPRDERERLAELFGRPPPSANLGAYWYWLGGNVTRAGITADLESMRAVGISTPMLFAIGKSGPETPIRPPADALTPLWWELVEHAAVECGRLGLTLALNDCDGWATASGPWITPELSMQCIAWSGTTVSGAEPVRSRVPKPDARLGYYRDIAAIALPWPEEWDRTSYTERARVTTSLPLKVSAAARINDPDNLEQAIDWAAVPKDRPSWIEYAFERPFTLRSITVRTPSPPGFAPGVYRAANSLEVEASDDGKTFRRIGALEYPRHGWQTDLTELTHAVPQTTARWFRLVHRPIPPQPYEEEYDFGQDTRLRLFSIVLASEPRIHQLPGKSGAQWAISRRTTAQDVPDDVCVPLESVIDLTGRINPDDSLSWTPPAGRWRILRIGCTTTGTENSAAGGAQGLECDKLSAVAATLQFDSWFGQALRRVGPRLAGKVLHVMHVDSWEAGAQNWSPVFAAGFRRLRGYDLIPYLAVMTGVPLVSADVSERFLHDVRRTINDLMATAFFGTLGELAHRHGCIFSAEPPNPTFPADGMQCFQYVDQPMGEFWLHTPRNDKPTDIKDAVCAARLYGKPFAQAESFTEGLITWDEHPYMLKPLADHNYCQGMGRLMLHVYAQQPWLDRAPGMTLSGIGSFFGRTQTWWQPGKAWFDYLRRCQALLQQGRAVADIAYFTGENIPARALLRRQLGMPPPPGYEFDSINRDALLRLASVRDGQVCLSTGARYRVLVLPDSELLSPEIATVVRDLVLAGAIVIGPRPTRSPGLTGYPAADAIVRSAGTVIQSRPLQAVLQEIGLAPDVELAASDGSVQWTHRCGEGWDLYFLGNQVDRAQRLEVAFRMAGRVPEIWHPDTGRTDTLALWREQDGRTFVALDLDPCGSLFVLFARPRPAGGHFIAAHPASAGVGPADPVCLLESDGRVHAVISAPGSWILEKAGGSQTRLELPDLPAPLPLQGPWTLDFPRGPAPQTRLRLRLEALVSWTELAPPAARYYSGTAGYETEFELPAALLAPARALWLDLGVVHEMAQVRVNGADLGVLWKPPFTVDITRAVRVGRNVLELQVTNTWRNRLIGDYGKSAAERTTYVVPMLRKGQPWLPGGPGATLSPAGVLGPVRVGSVAVVPVR